MSAYKTIQTKMTNINILKAALENIKPEWKGKIETTNGAQGVTIQGDSTVQGELVIKKQNAGTYGDIGVVRNPDGTFSLKISDVDTGSYFKDEDKREKQGRLFGAKFVGEVQQHYSLVEGIWAAAAAGAEVVSDKPFAMANVPGLAEGAIGVEMDVPRKLLEMA